MKYSKESMKRIKESLKEALKNNRQIEKLKLTSGS